MNKAKVLISILILFSLLFPAFFHADAARVAVIKEVKGEVYIKKGNGSREFKAKEGMSLSEGDSVRTVKKSSANIVYDDGSKTTVAPSSKLSITKLKNKGDGKQTKVKVVSGKVWNSVKSLSNANDEYDVETPTAVMGVRGTQFLVTTDPITGQATVSVLDGTVGVSQNSDNGGNSGGTSTSNGPSTQSEVLVTINQSLMAQSTQQPIPGAQTLDVRQLVQVVEPEVIVEIIQDLTNNIEQTNQQAIEAQKMFELTEQQQMIENALELAKTAAALANLQERVLNEINQSQNKTEIDQLLQNRFNQTLENAMKENTQLKTQTQSTQQQATNSALQAGMTQTQIDSVGPQTAPTNANPTAPTQPTGNTGGGGDSGGSSGGGPTTPINPIGEPVDLVNNTPLHFEGGISLLLNNSPILSGAKVTVTDVDTTTPDFESTIQDGLTVAGPIVDFSFENFYLTQGETANITLPIDNNEDIGIFHLNDYTKKWEYQPTTISGGYATATVTHFSTFGVLKASQAASPVSNINGHQVGPNTEIELTSATQNSIIYYTTDGTNPENSNSRLLYGDINKPIINRNFVTVKAIAVSDNYRNSPLFEETYTIDNEPPKLIAFNKGTSTTTSATIELHFDEVFASDVDLIAANFEITEDDRDEDHDGSLDPLSIHNVTIENNNGKSSIIIETELTDFDLNKINLSIFDGMVIKDLYDNQFPEELYIDFSQYVLFSIGGPDNMAIYNHQSPVLFYPTQNLFKIYLEPYVNNTILDKEEIKIEVSTNNYDIFVNPTVNSDLDGNMYFTFNIDQDLGGYLTPIAIQVYSINNGDQAFRETLILKKHESIDNLRVTEATASSVKIQWDDKPAADFYRIYKDGVEIAEVTSTEYEITGLQPGQYDVTVTAWKTGDDSPFTEATIFIPILD